MSHWPKTIGPMALATSLSSERHLSQLGRWLIAGDHLSVGQNDRRSALHADHLAKLILLGDGCIAAGCWQILASLGLVHCLLPVLGAPDAGQRIGPMTTHALSREGDITNLDTETIQLR